MIEAKKDMSKLNDLPKFGQVLKDRRGNLRNYTHEAEGVTMSWGWNDKAALDQIMSLSYRDRDGKHHQLMLDWQELLHYARGISMTMQEVKDRVKEEELQARGLK